MFATLLAINCKAVVIVIALHNVVAATCCCCYFVAACVADCVTVVAVAAAAEKCMSCRKRLPPAALAPLIPFGCHRQQTKPTEASLSHSLSLSHTYTVKLMLQIYRISAGNSSTISAHITRLHFTTLLLPLPPLLLIRFHTFSSFHFGVKNN